MGELPELESMNVTELQSIIRRQTGKIVRRSVPRERLIEMIEYGQIPKDEELSETMETRRILQSFIEKNWDWVNSQLPCKGVNRGKCTIYPCPEGRHMDCFTANQEAIRVHEAIPLRIK